MRPEVFNSQTVSLSPDCTVLIDHSDPKLVRVFETTTGKEMASTLKVLYIVSFCLVNSTYTRALTFENVCQGSDV
jgi:hypothetical protein